MSYTILVDFGSTFTKATVVSLESQELVFTTKAPTTVETDPRIGMEMCFEKIRHCIGNKEFSQASRLASSSAAGGLRMVVVGLTPSLSMMAGKNAAFGAGARVIKAYSHRLTSEDIDEIIQLSPEIILLCGGLEGGNVNWTIDNAHKLAECVDIHAPVVYAGNSKISNDIRYIFTKEIKECLIVRNIIPDLGILDVKPAVETIREVFMKRIVNMKGFDKVRQQVGDIIMPTPAAVLAAVKLLAQGTEKHPGLGEILVVDIGGATTDVHSFSSVEKSQGVRLIGAPEPRTKRTVEGDLGMRWSAESLVEAVGSNEIEKKLGITKSEFERSVKQRTIEPSFLPNTNIEMKLDFLLAEEAVRISTRRHAGKRFAAYSKGAEEIQKGKDLRGIDFIIGTGGPIVNSTKPEDVLRGALRNSISESDVLLPDSASFLLDKNYIFYAAGLLSQIDVNAAFTILRNNLLDINKH